MALSLPRGVLCDLDNTVYPYEPCHAAGLRRGWKAAAKALPRWGNESTFRSDYYQARQTVKKQVGRCAASHSRLLYFKTMLEHRLGRTDGALALSLQSAYWEGYFALMKPDAKCLEVLRSLRDRGVRLAWLTNFTTERQLLKLGAMGLSDVADVLVSSEEAGAEKPDPQIVDLALSHLGVSAEEVWLVGDDLSEDLKAAQARNIPFIWFCRERDGADPPPEGPAFIVHSWHELGELLGDERRRCHQ